LRTPAQPNKINIFGTMLVMTTLAIATGVTVAAAPAASQTAGITVTLTDATLAPLAKQHSHSFASFTATSGTVSKETSAPRVLAVTLDDTRQAEVVVTPVYSVGKRIGHVLTLKVGPEIERAYGESRFIEVSLGPNREIGVVVDTRAMP